MQKMRTGRVMGAQGRRQPDPPPSHSQGLSIICVSETCTIFPANTIVFMPFRIALVSFLLHNGAFFCFVVLNARGKLAAWGGGGGKRGIFQAQCLELAPKTCVDDLGRLPSFAYARGFI